MAEPKLDIELRVDGIEETIKRLDKAELAIQRIANMLVGNGKFAPKNEADLMRYFTGNEYEETAADAEAPPKDSP